MKPKPMLVNAIIDHLGLGLDLQLAHNVRDHVLIEVVKARILLDG